MILNETYTLENGLSIPKLGLGTWFIDDDQAAEAVRTAVKLGYRLIDTAQAYWQRARRGRGRAPPAAFRARSFLSPARWPRSSRPMTRPKSPSTKRSRRWALTTLTR